MLCIYHIADHDGKGSAAIVKTVFPETELMGLNHDMEVPYEEIEKHDKIVICDIALPVKYMLELNKKIASDKSLGKGFCIGHSYFCGQDTCTDEWLDSIVNYDILPMLSEYWFDDTAKLQRWENILRGVLQ